MSQPVRSRWTDSGLILWRADTLSPMRLLPNISNDEMGFQTAPISEESCVIGFGWCRAELPGSMDSTVIGGGMGTTTFAFDLKDSLRTVGKFLVG